MVHGVIFIIVEKMNADKISNQEIKPEGTNQNDNSGDINQNFLNDGSTRFSAQSQTQKAYSRGLNNSKPSPDSGWTFPNLMNSPMIPQGLIPHSQADRNLSNLHLPLNKPADNYNPAIFTDAYQPKMISPLVEMNLRKQFFLQQQQHYHQMQNVHHQSQFFNNSAYNASPVTNIAFNGISKENGSHNRSHPVITPNVENKNGSSLPSFATLTSGIQVAESPQYYAAVTAQQMNTYLSMLQKSQPKIPSNNGITLPSPSKNASLEISKTQSCTSENITNETIKRDKVSTSKPASSQIRPKRPTLLGHLKSMDQNRNKSNGPTYGNPSYRSVLPSMEKQEDKFNPQRPSHLGSTFVPQTQFLSVNVSHANDRPSSPGHQSPYSLSSTSSPAGSDKGKNPNNVCNQCGKMFSSSSALVKHKLTHSEERKFVCPICSRGFKRQDHLNGHMITHREKKPHECHFADCGKSYCDMRSLRRHLESHHSSPPGGTTPGYLPKLMLYPELSAEERKERETQIQENRLHVPEEPPRPSSAPLVVPPEPKRIQRTRRSSSGEETHMQLDPAMIREIEQRKHGNPFQRRTREESDEYIKPREETPPLGISPQSSGIASLPSHLLKTVVSSAANHRYSNIENHKREMEERRVEYGKHFQRDFKPPTSTSQTGKHESPYNYPPGLTPRSSLTPQGHPPRPTNAQGTMPYLLNIRNPFSLSPHGAYPSQQNEEFSKISKSEAEARHQAVSTYLQMWASGQHNMPPEQIFSMFPGGRGGPPRGNHRTNHPQTPTDAIAIAVAAAKEPNDRHPYAGRDGIYGIHPANAKWQSVMQDDSITMEKDSKVNSYYHNTQGNVHDNYAKRPTPTKERNIIDEPFKPSESNHKYQNNNNNNNINRFFDRPAPHLDPLKGREYAHPSHVYENKRRELDSKVFDTSRHPALSSTRDHSPHRYDPRYPTSRDELNNRLSEPPHLRVETAEGLASGSALSPNRKRPRPGPIIIPPAVNNRSIPTTISPSRHFAAFPKGIYTPPAMLSPRSIFFNPPFNAPRHHPNAPHTPGRMQLSKRRSSSFNEPQPLNTSQQQLQLKQLEQQQVQQQQQSVVQQTPKQTTPVSAEPSTVTPTNEEEINVTTVASDPTEPKINVGPEFQAVLPHVLNRTEAQKDSHRASLMWSPLKEDEQKQKEVEAYLDMACSLVLYGGSNNKEYALHILQRTRGNVKEAVRLLLSRRHILRADDPNADYHYSGSVRWTAKERLAFRQAYRSKGKIFMGIQKEVETKSVQQCVEFYYLWKAMHPESFRARTRMVEVESEQDDEEVPPTPTAAVAPLSTLREPVFECDYPECRARFVSRQALNGHIRVHGGSFTKPSDTRRAKTKAADGSSPRPPGDGLPSPPKKKKVAAPDPSIIITNTSEGPQQQFQCKVCGRVFSKVKSRSAHMKTHVKRDENNKPIKSAKATAKQKQKQLQQQRQQQQQQQQLQQQFGEHSMPPYPPQPTHPGPPQPPSNLNPMTVFAHA